MIELLHEHFWACWWLVVIVIWLIAEGISEWRHKMNTTTPAGLVSRESVREMLEFAIPYPNSSMTAHYVMTELLRRLQEIPDAELPAIGVSDAMEKEVAESLRMLLRCSKNIGQSKFRSKIEYDAFVETWMRGTDALAALRPSGEDR